MFLSIDVESVNWYFASLLFGVFWLDIFAAIPILLSSSLLIIARFIRFLYGKGLILDLDNGDDKNSWGEEKRVDKGEKLNNDSLD